MRDFLRDINLGSTADVIEAVDKVDGSNHLFSSSTSIHFLRNFTVEGIEPFLKLHLYRSDIGGKITFGEYDNIQQALLDPLSRIFSDPPEILVVSMILENLAPNCNLPSWDETETIAILSQILNGFDKSKSSLIVLNTFAPPIYPPEGTSGVNSGKDTKSKIAAINECLRQYVQTHHSKFFLVDFERIVMEHGYNNCFDKRYWYLSKAPFKRAFLNSYAEEIIKIVRALKGKAKKVLVLDCDDTLWGGIVGEDGISGIKLDPNEYPGKVFFDFQKSILTLNARGVLITLCSKNNESDVWEVLNSHQYCLLKQSHLSAWRINWEDKAQNIKSLQSELNLGIDSFVFIDNSPMECESVRKLLPEVTVLQVPTALHELPEILFKDGLFDTLTVSAEDSKRTKMYQDESLRKASQAEFESIEDYLASLELTATIHVINDLEIPRVAQLTQKTNQFNLTTKRLSESEIKNLVTDRDSKVFSLSVKDKFGDSGLTGVLIARKVGETGTVDSLLLSCRVLGRRVEYAFVKHCIERLSEAWAIDQWTSEYLPTKKNSIVETFWESLGFKTIYEKSGHKKYSARKDEIAIPAVSFITVKG